MNLTPPSSPGCTRETDPRADSAARAHIRGGLTLARQPAAASHGLYILADDHGLQWTAAFLNSVRCHEPALPITLIPHSQRLEATRRLADAYDIPLFADEETLARCDHISRLLHGRTIGAYRKLAAWSGPYERFVYIDTDVVITRRLDWIFGLLPRYPLLFADGPSPHNRPYVWRTSIDGAGFLTPEQIAFSANTGLFASTRGLFTMNAIEDKALDAALLKHHMDLGAAEQPFLNYLTVTSGHSYTSFRELRSKRLYPAPIAWWGGAPGCFTAGGRIRALFDAGRCMVGTPIMMVHWAGTTTKVFRGCSRWTDTLKPNLQHPRFGTITWFRYRQLWEFYAYRQTRPGTSFSVGDLWQFGAAERMGDSPQC